MKRVIVAAVLLAAIPALAQTPPPYGPQLQKATIVGRGSTIIIRRLPVVTPGGIVYRDITIDLKLDPSGAVRADATGKPVPGRPAQAVIAHEVAIGAVTETAAAPEVAAPFTPGLYKDAVAGGLVRVVDRGRRVGADFPTWALSAESGDTIMGAADWYGGPLRTNPHREMVERAGIIDERYSFGVVDGQGGGHFDQGMLIGAIQSGRTLTIVSFHRRGCCTYSPTPTSAITYTLVGR